MKLRTVIENKEYNLKKKVPKIIIAIMMMVEMFFNNILPFVLGFYFAFTRNIIFLVAWMITLFFHIRFDIKGENINIKIIRGI